VDNLRVDQQHLQARKMIYGSAQRTPDGMAEVVGICFGIILLELAKQGWAKTARISGRARRPCRHFLQGAQSFRQLPPVVVIHARHRRGIPAPGATRIVSCPIPTVQWPYMQRRMTRSLNAVRFATARRASVLRIRSAFARNREVVAVFHLLDGNPVLDELDAAIQADCTRGGGA